MITDNLMCIFNQSQKYKQTIHVALHAGSLAFLHAFILSSHSFLQA